MLHENLVHSTKCMYLDEGRKFCSSWIFWLHIYVGNMRLLVPLILEYTLQNKQHFNPFVRNWYFCLHQICYALFLSRTIVSQRILQEQSQLLTAILDTHLTPRCWKKCVCISNLTSYLYSNLFLLLRPSIIHTLFIQPSKLKFAHILWFKYEELL